MYCIYCAPLAVFIDLSGLVPLAMLICIVIVIGSVMLNLLVLNRIGEFNADQSDENFSAAKKMQGFAGGCSSLCLIWITVAVNMTRDGFFDDYNTLMVGAALCMGAIAFNAICLGKYRRIKRMHNADVMKRAKGDPNIIFSDEIELNGEEKSLVSQIALSAGVYPGESYKSEEELFAVIDDPVYAPLEERGERVCPFCGKKNPKKYTICAYCGQILPEPDANADIGENH